MSNSGDKFDTTVEDFEAQVLKIEGLQIRVYGKRNEKIAQPYEKYKNKLGGKKTVQEWKKIRLETVIKPGVEYEILDKDFEKVNGKKTLGNLRNELNGKE